MGNSDGCRRVQGVESGNRRARRSDRARISNHRPCAPRWWGDPARGDARYRAHTTVPDGVDRRPPLRVVRGATDVHGDSAQKWDGVSSAAPDEWAALVGDWEIRG